MSNPTENISVDQFLDAVEPASRRAEGRALDALFQRATGWKPRLWGSSIIGYGSYTYVYDSGHGGTACATGFSPRKAELVVYVMPGYLQLDGLLARLGKHRIGKACLYVRNLAAIDQGVLEEIVRAGLADLGARWPIDPS
ncbi:MAG: DUF1801 domain-containing protein [Sandaracinobacteroides sp.]